VATWWLAFTCEAGTSWDVVVLAASSVLSPDLSVFFWRGGYVRGVGSCCAPPCTACWLLVVLLRLLWWCVGVWSLAVRQFVTTRTALAQATVREVPLFVGVWSLRPRSAEHSLGPGPQLREAAKTNLWAGSEQGGRREWEAWVVGEVGRSEVICLLPATVVFGDGGGGSGLAVLCCGALVWREAVDPCLLGGVAVSSEVSSRVVAVRLLVIAAADFRLSCLRSVARAGRGCLSSPFVRSCSCVVVIGSSGPLLPSLSSLSCQLDRSLETGASTWLRVCVGVARNCWRVELVRARLHESEGLVVFNLDRRRPTLARGGCSGKRSLRFTLGD